MSQQLNSLAKAARSVLLTPDASMKAERTQSMVKAWNAGEILIVGEPCAPDIPARPEKPELLLPRDMPRRRAGGQNANRIALLHAVAHIELNAIDLACDIICRFASTEIPRSFFDDWLKVATEEAEHFKLINQRLVDMGSSYGALPAHDGLWQAAQETAHSLLARLAIVPLVFEARGLDVTPAMIQKFKNSGDVKSAAALTIIYEEEIGHVATGMRWYDWQCQQKGVEPVATWKSLVAQHFAGNLKPPFNAGAREQANFPEAYYLMEN